MPLHNNIINRLLSACLLISITGFTAGCETLGFNDYNDDDNMRSGPISLGLPSDVEASLLTMRVGETIRYENNKTMYLMDKYHSASSEFCYRVRYNKVISGTSNTNKNHLNSHIEIYCRDEDGFFESVERFKIEPDIFTYAPYVIDKKDFETAQDIATPVPAKMPPKVTVAETPEKRSSGVPGKKPRRPTTEELIAE